MVRINSPLYKSKHCTDQRCVFESGHVCKHSYEYLEVSNG